jgi:hypothetical protein
LFAGVVGSKAEVLLVFFEVGAIARYLSVYYIVPPCERGETVNGDVKG